MPNNPITDAALAELDRLRNEVRAKIAGKTVAEALLIVGEDATAVRQRLLYAEARLAEAERERDHWKKRTQLCSDCVLRFEQQSVRQWREGAVEAYERAADMLSVFPGGADAEEMMRDAAKRLRKSD